jgi:hypothetical protein
MQGRKREVWSYTDAKWIGCDKPIVIDDPRGQAGEPIAYRVGEFVRANSRLFGALSVRGVDAVLKVIGSDRGVRIDTGQKRRCIEVDV